MKTDLERAHHSSCSGSMSSSQPYYNANLTSEGRIIWIFCMGQVFSVRFTGTTKFREQPELPSPQCLTAVPWWSLFWTPRRWSLSAAESGPFQVAQPCQWCCSLFWAAQHRLSAGSPLWNSALPRSQSFRPVLLCS